MFSFPPAEYVERVEAWIDQVCGDGSGGWSRAEFEMHVRDEYSTFGWVLEEMLRRAGFEIDRAEYSSPTYALYCCTRPGTAAAGDGAGGRRVSLFWFVDGGSGCRADGGDC